MHALVGQEAPFDRGREQMQLLAGLQVTTKSVERTAEAIGADIGSGVIEAGCKTVIGSRLKRSGMFWTVRGANAILALRCSHLNGRFEDYWEGRRAA
jgi:hypothetical protein